LKLADAATTLVLAAAVLCVCLPRGGGVWLSLVLPVFLAWGIYTLVRITRSSAGRRQRVIRLALWAAVLAVAVGVQAYWDAASRSEATKVAGALAAFRSRTGVFPASMADAGLDEQALRGEWALNYRLREGKPRRSYPAALMPMTSYEYDFDAGVWRTDAY
jgi:hypothetical protein